MGLAIIGAKYLWPARTIPYEVDPAFPDPSLIAKAIQHWNSRTSIRFVPRSKQADYVRINRVPGGASSDVGRRGGKQVVSIGDGCPMGSVAHELGHAVGLWHEHCRNDRDKWVKIDFTNIEDGCEDNFRQNWISDGPAPTMDIGAYDYGSLMHYAGDSFPIDPASRSSSRFACRPRSRWGSATGSAPATSPPSRRSTREWREPPGPETPRSGRSDRRAGAASGALGVAVGALGVAAGAPDRPDAGATLGGRSIPVSFQERPRRSKTSPLPLLMSRDNRKRLRPRRSICGLPGILESGGASESSSFAKVSLSPSGEAILSTIWSSIERAMARLIRWAGVMSSSALAANKPLKSAFMSALSEGTSTPLARVSESFDLAAAIIRLTVQPGDQTYQAANDETATSRIAIATK
jgi:hypothetical protein